MIGLLTTAAAKPILGLSVPQFIMGIVLLILAVALIVLVLFQSGKDKRLSGTIAGAAETFFGKSKAASNEKKMTIATTIISILFAIMVLVMYFYIVTH